MKDNNREIDELIEKLTDVFEDGDLEELVDDIDIEDENDRIDFGVFKEKLIGAFTSLRSKALAVIEDDEKMEGLFKKVETTLNKIPVEMIPKIGQTLKDGFPLGDIGVMLSLLRAYALKRYTSIEKKNVIIAVMGLLYLVNPFDVIPDAIPIIGWFDDAFIIMLVLKTIKEEIDKYREWQNKNGTE